MKQVLFISIILLAFGVTQFINIPITVFEREINILPLIFAVVAGFAIAIYLHFSSRKREKATDDKALHKCEISSDLPGPERKEALDKLQRRSRDSSDIQIKNTKQKALKYALFIGLVSAVIENYNLLHVSFYTLLVMAMLDFLIGTVAAFPAFWVFFYFKDSDTADDIKKKVCDRVCPVDADVASDAVHRYHDMLERGIITEKEFKRLKKNIFREVK